MSASDPINAVDTGTMADFRIVDDYFFTGYNEVVQQNASVFNENSANTLRFVVENLLGEFTNDSFYKKVEGLVQHRNPLSVSPVESKKLEQGELITPKINRRLGPVRQTMDAFRKEGKSPEMFSYLIGQQYAGDIVVDLINTAITAGVAAISTEAGLVTDYSTDAAIDPGLRPEQLVSAMSKFGDKAQRIGAFVMHSSAYFALVQGQIVGNPYSVAGTMIYGGAPGTLGKPVIVTDSPALVEVDEVTGEIESYIVLGLTEDGVVITESEERYVSSTVEYGRENLIMLIQGETAYNVGVKGFSYAGGANPTNAQLATGANWEFQMHDTKLAAGVVLKVAA